MVWKVLAGLGLAVLAALGLLWWLQPAPEEPGHRPETVMRLRVVKPKRGGLDRVCTQPATVESWEYVDLFAQVTGILKHQDVDINSQVHKDQLLAEVDAPDIVKERDLARAVLVEALDKVKMREAQLEAAGAQLRLARQTVARRKAEVIAATAYVSFRDIQLDRITKLAATTPPAIENDLVVEEQGRHRAARYRKDGSVLAVQQAEEDVKAKAAEVEEAVARVQLARGDVDVAQATLDKAQVFVDFTRIQAPFRGVITYRGFNNEAFLRAKDLGGQVPLLTVQRTDKFRVVTYVLDNDVPYVRVGDPAELRVFTLGMVFPGKVTRRALSQHEDSRLMRTEIDLTNERGLLRDGMYGEVTIRLSNVAELNPDVVNLPSACLQDEGQAKERTVYVVRPAGPGTYSIHAVQVLVGYNQDRGKLNGKGQRREDLRVEVLQGLTPADRVVVGPVAAVHEGGLVAVQE